MTRDTSHITHHLDPRHVVAVLGRGRNTRHDLGLPVLELRGVVIDVLDVDADDDLALPGAPGPLALYVEGVEEERNLLGGLCRGSLK